MLEVSKLKPTSRIFFVYFLFIPIDAILLIFNNLCKKQTFSDKGDYTRLYERSF